MSVFLIPHLSFYKRLNNIVWITVHEITSLAQVRHYLTEETSFTIYKTVILPFFDYENLLIVGIKHNLNLFWCKWILKYVESNPNLSSYMKCHYKCVLIVYMFISMSIVKRMYLMYQFMLTIIDHLTYKENQYVSDVASL